MTENEISKIVVDTAIKLHKDLGPGLLESVYEVILSKLLGNHGLHVQRQAPISINYEGINFTEAFRADLIINNSVIIELKSSSKHDADLFRKQIATYLKLTNLKLGLVLNFGLPLMSKGLIRVVNNLPE